MQYRGRLTVLGAAALLLTACQATDLTTPASNGPPAPAFEGETVTLAGATFETGRADYEQFEVCKYGSTASFSYTVDLRSNGTGVDQSDNFNLSDGQCVDVAGVGFLGADVTVTETGTQSGFHFGRAVLTTVTGANCEDANRSYNSTLQTNTSAAGFISGSSSDGICDGLLVEYFNKANAGGEGCTPGYWKQPHHFGNWASPYLPTDLFSAYFDNAFPGMTLLQVLSQGGGGLNALGRHTVAALLNAASSGVGFGLTTSQVISAFNAVFPGTKTAYNQRKDIFATENERGCPLN